MKKLSTLLILIMLGIILIINNSFSQIQVKSHILKPDKSIKRTSKVLSNTIRIRLKAGSENIIQGNALLNKAHFTNQTQQLKSQLSFTNNPNMIKASGITSQKKISNIIEKEEPLLRTYTIDYDGDEAPEIVCKKLLNENPYIEVAEPCYVNELLGKTNDTYVNLQSMLDSIKAFDAWNICKGDTSVTIAISDIGVNQALADLASNIKKNWGDIVDGIDNDNNDYTDDFNGYNFGWQVEGSSPNNTYHTESHGTEVASIAAAVTNNSLGIAGVGYNCTFFPIKSALSTEGTIRYGYESLIYAAVRKFKVVNCSWGVAHPFSYLEQSIIDYANASDVVIVGAADDYKYQDQILYPAGYKGVLGVGEVDQFGNRTETALGCYVRIMAPGYGNYAAQLDGTYSNSGVAGTSFAAPVVSGVVAIARTKNPNLNASQIIEFVRQCSDDITSINPNDAKIIPGRVNMLKAVTTDPMSILGIRPEKYIYKNSTGVVKQRFDVGELIHLSIDAHNYLGSATNVRFVLSDAYDQGNIIGIINDKDSISSISANEDFTIADFTFKYNDGYNNRILLRVDIYRDSTYHDFFLIPFIPTPEMITLSNSSITFSLGDRGTIGYNTWYYTNQFEPGIGFNYSNYGSFLSEAGLMVAENQKRVVSSNYGTSSDGNDFATVKSFIQPDSSISIINDSYASSDQQIGVQIQQYYKVPEGNYPYCKVILNLKNISGTTLKDISVGYFFDWDIGSLAYNCPDSNVTQLLPEGVPDFGDTSNFRGMAEYEAFYHGTAYPIYGASVGTYEWNSTPQAAGLDRSLTDNFSSANQIKSLYSGTTLQKNDTADASFVIGMRFPNETPAGSSHFCEFCFAVAMNKTDLANNLKECMKNITTSVSDVSRTNDLSLNIYPQPALSDKIMLALNLPNISNVEVHIYNIMGLEVLTPINIYNESGNLRIPIDINTLSDGLYIAKLIVNGKIISKSFIRTK